MASFSVVSNIASNNAQANLYGTQVGLQKALTRLSSGFRINVSGDDAAGQSVANTYRNDNAVITQGIRNANDGLSVLQVKDGALSNVSTLLDRLSTLATQAASAGTSGVNTGTLQTEANGIVEEIGRELNVAGLTTNSDFGVFISNDSAQIQSTAGGTGATIAEGTWATGGATLALATGFTFAAQGTGHAAVTVAGAFAAGDPVGDKQDAIMLALQAEYDGLDEKVEISGTGFTITTGMDEKTAAYGQVTGDLTAISLGAAAGGSIGLNIQGSSAGTFLDITDKDSAATAVATLKTALASIGAAQGTIGTLQNKLTFAVSLAQSQQVNKKAAESRIRDANIAEESANMTRYNILTQSGIAALAQANQSTSSVLSLLR